MLGSRGVSHRHASLLLVALVAGCRSGSWPDVVPYCAGSPSRPAAGGSGPSLDELCTSVASSLCAQWARCGCIDAAGRDDCETSVLATCDGFVGTDDVRDALARGTLVWSGREASAFVAALDAATAGCDAVDLDLSGAAIGRVGFLAPCTDISGAFTECADGQSCQIFLSDPRGGTTGGRFCTLDQVTEGSQPEGEACDGYAGWGCRAGLRCAPVCGGGQFDGTCVPVSATGADCRWDRDCASGYCAFHAGGDSYPYAARGQCAAESMHALGDACTSDRDCASGRCAIARPLLDTRVFVGGSCAAQLDEGAECLADSECATGACGPPATVARLLCLENGAPCTVTRADCTCAMTVGPMRTCIAPQPDGAPCATASGCVGGRCELPAPAAAGALCTSSAADGAPCARDAECASRHCILSVCTTLDRGIGAPCTGPEACDSASCLAGACAPAVCTARLDPTGHGSFWLHPALFTPP